MKPLHIILIVCGGLLLLFILFIILVRRSNRKRYYRLQENLRKYQKENEDFDNDKSIQLDDGVKISGPQIDNQSKGKKGKINPTIEDYVPEKEEINTQQEENIDDFFTDEDFFDETDIEMERRKKRDDEFENFMNEHAFSRKILDKNLVNKIKRLSPELQSIILNSVFEKFDDKKD